MSGGIVSTVLPATLMAAAVLAVAPVTAQSAASAALKIDKPSMHLGEIAAFAELVGIGTKRLAFSDVLSPEEAAQILPEAERIAHSNGVQIYREPDLIVTDLFPADIAKGKVVLLIYKGSTLEEYLALKRDKEALVRSGAYTGKAREQIAWRLGKLLSYPDAGIAGLLKKNTVRE